MGGIVCGWHVEFNGVLLFALLTLSFGGALLATMRSRTPEVVKSVACFVLIVLAGAFKIHLDRKPAGLDALREVIETNTPVIIRGTVTDPPRFAKNRLQFVVDADTAILGDEYREIGGSILVSMNLASTSTSLDYGSVIDIRAKLVYPGTARNPGEFDLRRYLNLQGVYARAFLDDTASVLFVGNRGNWFLRNIIYPARRSISRSLDVHVGGEEARFLKGLTIGDRSEISHEVKASFVNAGVMHILAVSGLHVGLITLIFIALFTALRIPEKPRVVIVSILLLCFVFLTGSSPSVVRASTMAAIVLGAILFERKSDIINSLAFAATVILSIDARQLFLPGFQLSFAAVLSIVILYPRFYEAFQSLPESIRNVSVINGTIRLLCLSLAAGLGTLPFTAMYFGKIPVIGFLANLVVVPLSGIVLALGMTTIGFSFLSNILASAYSEVARLVTHVLLTLVSFLGNLSFSYVDLQASPWEVLVYFGAIGVIVQRQVFTIRRLIPFLLVVMNIILYAWVFASWSPSSLRITFLDVGQGDAAFVEFPNGTNMLIDAGPRTVRMDAGSRFVVPFLRAHGIRSINTIVVSHPHSDHFGGVPAIMREFRTGRVVDAGSKASSSLFREYAHLIDSLEVGYRRVVAGDTIDCGGDIRVYVLHPSGRFVPGETSGRNLNEESVVVKLVYGQTSVLFSGDAEHGAEDRMVDAYDGFLKSDLLKVGHHGSKTSTTSRYLGSVDPRWGIVSVGKGNVFRHPSEIVLQRLRDRMVHVRRTDEHNAVIFMSDGASWQIEPWR
jgi:competence protein ComEC